MRLCRRHNRLRETDRSCLMCWIQAGKWKNAKYPKSGALAFGRGYGRKWSSGQPDAAKHREQDRAIGLLNAGRRGR